MEITREKDNPILIFLECGKCLEEMPAGQSPQSYGRLEVGTTKDSLRIRCVRHDGIVREIPMTGLPTEIECSQCGIERKTK